MEIIFHSHANKTHFHKKGCTLGLILKVRVFGTRKWPIGCGFFGENLKTDFRSQIIWILYYLKNGRSEKGSFTMLTACPRALRDEKTEEIIKTTN